MKSFQQSCPGCQSVLELPVEADGKTAMCPSCQTQFTASAVEDEAQGDPDADTLPETRRPRSAVPLHHQSVAIETIFRETQSVFYDRQQPLIFPFLLPSAMIVLGVVIPIAILNDLAITNLNLAIYWSVILSPCFLVIGTYATWFALRSANSLCDAKPFETPASKTDLRTWLVPRFRTFVTLLLLVVMGSVFIAILVGLMVVLIDASSRISALEVRLLCAAWIFILIPSLMFFAGMRLWPMLPLAIIDRTGIIAIRDSLAMTGVNRMTSFCLTAAIFSALGFGFGLAGMGLLVAVPVSALALVVGFRLIGGLRIPALENRVG